MASNFEQQYETRALDKLAQITSAGFFRKSSTSKGDSIIEIAQASNEMSTDQISVSRQRTLMIRGRIMSNRRSGKSGFIDVQQDGARLQVYLRQDVLGIDNYAIYKLLDRGDIIEVTGRLFRTTQGELTIEAKSLFLLTKCLRPLPDKFNGLTDTEACYRQRYIDLFTNSETQNVFKTRSAIIAQLRRLLTEDGFMEVETPMLQVDPGGATANPFVTQHHALDQVMYLRVAPELYLKRLIVGGFDKVFELNRNFRNEGLSTRHNPEFTMLEYYEAYNSVPNAMLDVIDLLTKLAVDAAGTPIVDYQGQQLDFENTKIIHMPNAIDEVWRKLYPNELLPVNDDDAIVYMLTKFGLLNTGDKGKNIIALFENLVEPNLIQPTIVYGFPKSVSPLAAVIPGNEEWADRFEIYAAGMELGNGYQELNDSTDQLQRMSDQVIADPECSIDYDYIEALRYGLPPTVGVGLGIDRLVMLLTNQTSIKDVILFPTLKNK